MQLFLQLSKLQGTTSYLDENVGRVGVKFVTVIIYEMILNGLYCILMQISRVKSINIFNLLSKNDIMSVKPP